MLQPYFLICIVATIMIQTTPFNPQEISKTNKAAKYFETTKV